MSDGPDIQAVLIVVLVAAIVGYTGLQVFAAEVTKDDLNEFEKSEKYTTTGCMGIVCGVDDVWNLFGVALVVLVVSVILVYSGMFAPPVPRERDDLDGVKQLYVEGEIGILEFEERVKDEIEGEENE